MADLEFKRRVQEIPGTPDVPEYQRRENIKIIQNPDIQSAGERNAAATNWMSSLGSEIATRSSNALAAKLGNQMGENPEGDLLPSFTDFDKNVEQSYTTQAHATLGIEAQKLITKSNIELASYPRLDHSIISKSQAQIQQGLQKIYSLAPESIRPQLENQYDSVMIAQGESLIKRMIREQKEDRQNTLDLSSNYNTQNAYTLSLQGIDLDKNGDSIPALNAVKAIQKSYENAVLMKDVTPLQAKVAIDSARQSYLSGKIIRLGLEKQSEGKIEEFEKELADNPSKFGITPNDHNVVLKNFVGYINNQKALRNENENLNAQLMYNKIITNPNISGTEWAAFEKTVSPLKAAQLKFHLLQAQNKKTGNNEGVNNLIAHYGDARVQAQSSPEIKNSAFTKSVKNIISSNPNIPIEQAEIQVAQSGAAPAPVFTQTLKIGLWSGDAAQMVEKARQIDELQLTGNGHALTGLNDSDLALASDISHNNNPADPSWSARMITENKENQDSKVRELSQAAFNNYVYQNTIKNNTTTDDWILSKFNITGGLFSTGIDSPWLKGRYVDDILSVYNTNYINTRRDENRATLLTQQYIKNNYGKTKINGSYEFSKHPIEKACGFNEGEGIPEINKDILRQISIPMENLKKKYEEKIVNEYWSVEPGKENRLQFVKHTREGLTQKFPLRLVGNNFNWELNVETEDGPMSIFLAAPTIGVHKYTPDINWIREEYLKKDHQSLLTRNYSKNLNSILNPSLEGNE
jgi:hypothetical protein